MVVVVVAIVDASDAAMTPRLVESDTRRHKSIIQERIAIVFAYLYVERGDLNICMVRRKVWEKRGFEK